MKNTQERWNELQEIGVTMEMLGDIIGTTKMNISYLISNKRGKYSLYASKIRLAIFRLHEELTPVINNHRYQKKFMDATVAKVKGEMHITRRVETEGAQQGIFINQ